ncbi:hypothetical protein Asch02_02181 [Acinetobacter schindleri]
MMTFIEVCKSTGKVNAKVISLVQPKENDAVEYINVAEIPNFRLEILNDVSNLHFDLKQLVFYSDLII